MKNGREMEIINLNFELYVLSTKLNTYVLFHCCFSSKPSTTFRVLYISTAIYYTLKSLIFLLKKNTRLTRKRLYFL